MPTKSPSPRKASRARREPLSRDRILRAALRMVDERGTAALTMRKLGAALGVEAMSLYKYVENKEDVIRGTVELVQSEVRFPEDPDHDWQARLYQFCKERRSRLLRHPNMVPYLLRYGGGPSMQAQTERALECATSAGLHGDDVHHLLHLLSVVVFGSALLDERTRSELERGGPFPSERPLFEEYVKYFRSCDGEAEFEFGVRLILRYFDQRLADSPTTGAGALSISQVIFGSS